jgi:hypothetical protein
MGLLNSIAIGIGEGAKAAQPYIANLQVAEIQKLRDDRLAALQDARDTKMEGFASAREERGYAHQDKTQTAAQEFTKSENALGRDFTKSESKLDRDLRTALAKTSDATARAGIGVQMAQLQLAKDHVQLVPQADGTMWKMKPDGTTIGQVVDADGKPVVGPKDVSKSAQLLMEGNIKAMEMLKTDIDMPQEEKNRMTKFYLQTNERLAGLTPGAAPTGQTGWDSTSGKVLMNGKEIGSAKTEAEARALVSNAKTPSTQPAATVLPPSTGLLGGNPTAPPSKEAAYQTALKELSDMKGGILPTPRGKEQAIKDKEDEVNRLYKDLYR